MFFNLFYDILFRIGKNISLYQLYRAVSAEISAARGNRHYSNNLICAYLWLSNLKLCFICQCFQHVAMQAFFNCIRYSMKIMGVNQSSIFCYFSYLAYYIPCNASCYNQFFFRVVLFELSYLPQGGIVAFYSA